MARWTASAKWAEGPALDGQRDMPLALRLSEGLGLTLQDAQFVALAKHMLLYNWPKPVACEYGRTYDGQQKLSNGCLIVFG